MPIQTADNKWATAKWIVNPIAGLGTHTTIQDAVTAASSGDIIVVMPKSGGYTEDITMKAGITLTAYIGQELIPDIYITGKITCDYSGTSSISGLYLITNSDNFLSFTGSNTCNLQVECCALSSTNATGITCTNNNASIIISRSYTFSSVGYALFDVSPAGLAFRYCYVANSGTVTLSDIDSGYIEISNCVFSVPFSISSAARLVIYNSTVGNDLNTTSITYQSSNITSIITQTDIYSGSATALIVNTGQIDVLDCSFQSTNTNAISGSGTIRYAGLCFQAASNSNISVTSQIVAYEGPSKNIGSTNSGGTNTLTITNDSNTASSNATIACNVAGSSAGDARYQASTTSTSWSWGADNSDSDALVFSQGTTLGTNNVIRTDTTGVINYPLQSCFSAKLETQDNNVTGNNTIYSLGKNVALTVLFDQNNDFYPGDGAGTAAHFTAPVTGQYLFIFSVRLGSTTGTTNYNQFISTTSTAYYNAANTSNTISAFQFNMERICHMSAGDTAVFNILLNGIGADTANVLAQAAGQASTIVSGYLVA